ncbi:transcriptional regulatory protein GAL4 [Ilyonectria destructans]|nr:transcriptional regulatory protein GAL4 [Ilyonectria destructans]
MASNGQSVPTSTDAGSPQVLKKRKRNSERARVTRACDRCKKRKIKCNGAQPCEFCIRAKASCTFNSAYARGRVPAILPASDVESGSNSILVDDALTQATQHPLRLQSHDVSSSYLVPLASASAAPSSQSSPEPVQTDLQGHYIGPASGVSFLLRVQKRLHQAISFHDASTIFTFGDAPLQLPEFDPSFCMMLPRDDAQRLVDRYFDFAMPTYRFLHRPTVQEWFEEFYDTLGIMRDAHSAPAKVALLFMVFAQARVYMPDSDRPGPPDLSTRYFLAAEHQLTKERGSIRLTSVQARLTQCFYLLTQSRINHCWSLFGTMSHLALAIGLNRNRRPGRRSGLSVVEAQCRRRTFWCAYTLDAYLSVALGRPRSFHDDDIDTELPACVDDDQLTAENIATSPDNRSPSTMLAPIAHIKVARIISKIVRDLYAIKPISTSRRSVLTERISKDLSDWQVEFARFLDTDFFSTSLVPPIFQRQQNVLNLTYWHAIILTHRPFVLTNFARLSRKDGNSGIEDAQTVESVQQCLMAAMKTVKKINDITQTRQMFHAFWITAYFAFTATIVLYIYVIQNRASPPELYSSYFAAATKCQSHISAMAEKGSLSERYCLVLEELRVEALRQAKRMHPTMTNLEGMDDGSHGNGFPQSTASMPLDDTPSDIANYTDVLGDNVIDFNGMPSSAFSDSSGWGQFASMVSSGLGNLDLFLNDDTFTI